MIDPLNERPAGFALTSQRRGAGSCLRRYFFNGFLVAALGQLAQEVQTLKPQASSLQLKLISDGRGEPRRANADRVGRIFSDGYSDIRVTHVSRTNAAQVFVSRSADGKSWAVSAGLVRLITKDVRKKRAA